MLSKTSHKSKNETGTPAASGTRGSLSFLHKLNPHNKTSPTLPENSFAVQVEQIDKNTPVDSLKLTPELKPTAIADVQTPADEVWFEPHTDPNRTHLRPGSIISEGPSPLERRANEREAVQIALEKHLEDFRGGRMRALNDVQVNKMQAMHESQLKLTALRQALTEIDDPLQDLDMDEQYAEIGKCLDELHQQIVSFGEVNSGED
ncbi:unnamed protein product [Bursaphelenchus okinawaensis]|uniref:Uncharacterized protein n=1 Tax=Bursaphelenchus okinawaensis TaxID=465554 RepID=A0A811JRD4_9BILA|nr:unnamed protein product [Bursaphelenchus okinawaensis]CAG9079623.1 unnamed protein product [Bursaphelenchus okinawaensis]